MEYHYRVSLTAEKSAEPVFAAILKAFKNDIKTYAVGYELVVEPNISGHIRQDSPPEERFIQNHHIHCHLEYSKYDEVAFSKRRQRLIKTLKKDQHVPDKNGAQYHEKLDKTRFQNLRYCLKNKNIIAHNLSVEELEEVNKDNERIEAEKKKSMKEQLYDNWISQTSNLFMSKGDAFQYIDEYHVTRDYLPPTNSLLTQYSKYILIKQYKAIENPSIHITILYNKVLNELNGIRMEQQTYSDITAVNAMEEVTRSINKMIEPHKKQYEQYLLMTNDMFIDSDDETEETLDSLNNHIQSII